MNAMIMGVTQFGDLFGSPVDVANETNKPAHLYFYEWVLLKWLCIL